MMGFGRDYGYGGYGNMMDGYGGLMFGFFALLVLVGIVVLVIWAVRTMGGSGSHHAPQGPPAVRPLDDACSIARTRYAKGEITKEQYEEMCSTLSR